MKKLILAAFALTTAASVFAQGTVLLNNRLGGQAFNQTTHIWGPSPTAATLSLIGIGSNDLPVSSALPNDPARYALQDFAGAGMQLIGAGGATGAFGYRTTFAQLIGAAGLNQPLDSLTPRGASTTFRTGTSLGDVAGITATIEGIPGDAGSATFAMVAWDNSSGLYANWGLASAAWKAGTIAAGISPTYNVSVLGAVLNTPAALSTAQPMSSFNLYYASVIPEPSSFALAGLGAAALLIFRRRK